MNNILLVLSIFTLLFVGVNFLLLMAVMYILQRIQSRNDSIYERVYKIETVLQHLQMQSMAEQSLGYPFPEERTKAIRTPGGIIMATSLEDFLRKVNEDPMFKGISKEQLEELRKLFEEHNSNTDEDDTNEPWQK